MNWECPYCGHKQLASDSNQFNRSEAFRMGQADMGHPGYAIEAVRCLNEECNKIRVFLGIGQFNFSTEKLTRNEHFQVMRVLPDSASKPQPSYIPGPIVEDYEEACLIRDKSPKAAATLARRCLQGMIRDFCGISKSRLVDEIDELREKVDNDEGPRGVEPEAIEAINHTRAVGNIGAHMERDIGVIVPVDPGEAQSLIELIEMLFEEWYVARYRRQQRLARIKEVAETKASQKELARQKRTETEG